MGRLSMATRKELTTAVSERYPCFDASGEGENFG